MPWSSLFTRHFAFSIVPGRKGLDRIYAAVVRFGQNTRLEEERCSLACIGYSREGALTKLLLAANCLN